jgi:hypothetical protein
MRSVANAAADHAVSEPRRDSVIEVQRGEVPRPIREAIQRSLDAGKRIAETEKETNGKKG